MKKYNRLLNFFCARFFAVSHENANSTWRGRKRHFRTGLAIQKLFGKVFISTFVRLFSDGLGMLWHFGSRVFFCCLACSCLPRGISFLLQHLRSCPLSGGKDSLRSLFVVPSAHTLRRLLRLNARRYGELNGIYVSINGTAECVSE
jgi:hypothetical protein